jgi:hypothetical protein
MMLRRRFKQSLEKRLSKLNSLEERLSEEAKRLREEAKLLPLALNARRFYGKLGKPKQDRI